MKVHKNPALGLSRKRFHLQLLIALVDHHPKSSMPELKLMMNRMLSDYRYSVDEINEMLEVLEVGWNADGWSIGASTIKEAFRI